MSTWLVWKQFNVLYNTRFRSPFWVIRSIKIISPTKTGLYWWNVDERWQNTRRSWKYLYRKICFMRQEAAAVQRAVAVTRAWAQPAAGNKLLKVWHGAATATSAHRSSGLGKERSRFKKKYCRKVLLPPWRSSVWWRFINQCGYLDAGC